MKALYKLPRMNHSIVVDLPDISLHTLQTLVGGYIEPIKVASDAVILVDEEGALKSAFETNSDFWYEKNKWNGAEFYGPGLFLFVKGEEFVALTDDDVKRLQFIGF